jgi:SAM-dependent methyltransferase
MNKEMYDKLSESERAEFVKNYYDVKEGNKKYATSPDINLRELEIDFILNNIHGQNILDMGCGNGYTLIRIAEKISGNLIGVDFSSEMIKGTNSLIDEFKYSIKSKPVFYEGDATTYNPPKYCEPIDTVITERFLLNLPNEELQYKVIKNIHKILKPGGTYIMVEGTKDGLGKLNNIRKIADLDPIPDRDKQNLSSLKFEDTKLENFLTRFFSIVDIKTFDLYYLISRVIYPAFIRPEQPKFDHFVNTLARELDQVVNFPSKGIGHVKGYVLKKK